MADLKRSDVPQEKEQVEYRKEHQKEEILLQTALCNFELQVSSDEGKGLHERQRRLRVYLLKKNHLEYGTDGKAAIAHFPGPSKVF